MEPAAARWTDLRRPDRLPLTESKSRKTLQLRKGETRLQLWIQKRNLVIHRRNLGNRTETLSLGVLHPSHRISQFLPHHRKGVGAHRISQLLPHHRKGAEDRPS